MRLAEWTHFWQAMGFVPLAFRTGSAKKDRVHIFWQKRIRAGDTETPWWFPSKTDGGAMREDRIVLPIPHGVNWFDEMPRILPRDEGADSMGTRQLAIGNPKRKRSLPMDPPKKEGPRQFGAPSSKPMPVVPAAVKTSEPPAKRERKPKVKADPRMISAARELRDRWLEAVNRGEFVALPEARYDVSREIEDGTKRIALLPAA
jgi:hypothetical protein